MNFGEEEIWEAVKRMKKRKACGKERIPMEAWMYAEVGVREGLVDLLRQI